MRTYLVTGGAGFIGSNYIHYMFQKYDNEIRIINVDKLTYAGNLENLKDIENRDNYTFVKADICDSEAIMKVSMLCMHCQHVMMTQSMLHVRSAQAVMDLSQLLVKPPVLRKEAIAVSAEKYWLSRLSSQPQDIHRLQMTR